MQYGWHESEDWEEDEIVMIDDGEADGFKVVQGWSWWAFGIVRVSDPKSKEEVCELIHTATYQPVARFESRYVAQRAVKILAGIGDWNAANWPLTRAEVGLLWFRAGFQPIPYGRDGSIV